MLTIEIVFSVSNVSYSAANRSGRQISSPSILAMYFPLAAFRSTLLNPAQRRASNLTPFSLQAPYYFPVCRVVDENARYVRTVGQGHAVRSEMPLEVTDVVMKFAFIDRIEGIPVVGLGVKERNAAGMAGHRKG